MANLSITADDVHIVRATDNELLTAPAGEAGNAGQYFRLNTTTGKLEKGNATTTTELGNTYGILIETVAVGQTATIALPGALVDVGDALDALAFDAPVYVSDTDATLADSAGTVSRVFGRVEPGFASTTADKLLRVK